MHDTDTRARGRSTGRARPHDPRRTERVLAAERRIGAVAWLMDEVVRVPGTRVRVGLDPLIGLIPGLGDVAGAAISAWVVLEGVRLGLPWVVVARMVLNAVVDLLVGLVPVLGDLFDLGFRANSRNLALLHRHGMDPEASTAEHATLLAGLVLLAVGVAWVAIVLVGRALTTVP